MAQSHANGRSGASIAVVIPTRDRGDSVLRPLRSILASDYHDFEIVVVDQSTDSGTEDAVAALGNEVAVRYLRTETRGLSNALNDGIAATTSDTIAITGDDCEVRADWLARIDDAFAKDSRIAVVFGNVRPEPHDPGRGFVQAYVREQPVLACQLREKHRIGGTSASMAVRRRVCEELHGFDPLLGVGAAFRAAEETDFAIRALRAGHWVLEEPAIEVIHAGFKTWDELPGLIERNWFGTGAALAKVAKQLPASAAVIVAGLAWNWAFLHSGVAASLGHTSHRRLRLLAFARGMSAGLRRGVDPRTGHFVRTTSASINVPKSSARL